MAGITLRNVDKFFNGSVHAVRDFDLEVRDGEMIVLVGPSGCGKSTILRMIAGLESVSSGDITIGGRSVTHLPPERRDVAMVFQNYALYPHMTVRKNLGFPLKMTNTDKETIPSRVETVADMLRLTSYLDSRPGQLSGGQRQRVAMGRALVREPAVFLLDEPLSNLDAKLRVQMRSEITELQKRLGTTTVYVTHDQVEAMTMGDRLAVIRGGKLQQSGKPQAIYRHPANVFVASFIGSPSMNLFRTRIDRGKDGCPEFHLGNSRVRLSDTSGGPGKRFVNYTGRDAVVGLRPESFTAPDAAPEECRLAVDITHTEALGHEFIVYFDVPVEPLPEAVRDQLAEDVSDPAGHTGTEADAGSDTAPDSSAGSDSNAGSDAAATVTMAARIPPGLTPERGGSMTLGIDPEGFYLFDCDGRAITGD